jgi:hypothetical protein
VIYQNDRLATVTLEKNANKSTNRICKKYKYTQFFFGGGEMTGHFNKPVRWGEGPNAIQWATSQDMIMIFDSKCQLWKFIMIMKIMITAMTMIHRHS